MILNCYTSTKKMMIHGSEYDREGDILGGLQTLPW